jgi:urea transport system ATP-binding protein
MMAATPAEVSVAHGVVLYLNGVTVSFDGFKALNNLSLTIDAGELRCVIGPNGAGKTTMMDVITGKTRPDDGSVFFNQSVDLSRLSEAKIAHAGIGRKFQKPTIFEPLTVFENLELAMKADKRARTTLFSKLSSEERGRIERTAELFVSLAGAHSLVVVEHDMAFIETIARKVTVLHEGSVLAEGPMDKVQNDPRVIEVYLGR